MITCLYLNTLTHAVTDQYSEPSVILTSTDDYDNDGLPDTLDPDDDNDGVPDTKDFYPKNSSRFHDGESTQVLITTNDNTEPLTVTEMGKSTTFNVRLLKSPESPVVLPVIPPTNIATINVSELVFTPENWEIDQPITLTGTDDTLERGNREFKLAFKPLLSQDSTFNGQQVQPIELVNRSLEMTTSISETFESGSNISIPIVTNTNEKAKLSFSITDAPQGLMIHPRTHKLLWTPTQNQVGTHHLHLVISSTSGGLHEKMITLIITDGGTDPAGVYIVPGLGVDDINGGSASAPLATLRYATEEIATAGQTVYIRGGIYTHSDKIRQNKTEGSGGTLANPITIKPYGNEKVIFKYDGYLALKIESSHIIVDGIEIDGLAVNDHIDILKRCWWKKADPIGASKCIQANSGNHIVIKNCVLHDAVEKGVEILDARYVTVKDNIIYNIGHHSFAGGHGIMRKWDKDYGDDDMDYFRLDITGNLIFGIGQRIYSWVTSKSFSTLTIDEGKTILIDDTDDTQCKMRISNNLMLYNGIIDICPKKTPNFEIFNNSSFSDKGRIDPAPSGIVAKAFAPGAKIYNNAAETISASGSFSIHADKLFPELQPIAPATEADYSDYKARFYGNYTAGGGKTRPSYIPDGIINLGEARSLFRDPAQNDFRMKDDLPQDVGVPASELTRMMNMAADHGVTIKSNNWRHNHIYMTYIIIHNVDTENFTNPIYYEEDSETGEPSIVYDVSATWRDARIAEGQNVWQDTTKFKLKLGNKFNDWVTTQKELDNNFNPITDLGSNSQDWIDFDGDGVGNANDDDDDNDGINDSLDQFPRNKKEWFDHDNDGIGDNEDLDDDGDGILDTNDNFPLDNTQAPTASTGADQSINLPSSANLHADVNDAPLSYQTITWTQISAPSGAVVNITDRHLKDTTASFPAKGLYILRLTVENSKQVTHNYLFITVEVGINVSLNGTSLEWTVMSENGVKNYVIQQEIDGEWTDIKTITAEEKTNTTYSETVDPLGIYRIKSVNNNGSSNSFDMDHSVTIPLNEGWNLISFPHHNLDLNHFKTKSKGKIWGWENNRYEEIEQANAMRACWLYCDTDGEIKVMGDEVENNNVGLNLGWNLIGPADTIKAPNAFTIFSWNSWDKKYSRVRGDIDYLFRGRGYWIFTSEQTTIRLGKE